MNKAILILIFIGFASAFKADAYYSLWSSWKIQHKKIYSASEELTRFDIFIENFEKIARLNSQNNGVKFGLNQFADLTNQQFTTKYTSSAGASSPPTVTSFGTKSLRASVGDLPESVDWRTKGAVTPVKTQGECVSGWAFSATGVLESYYFIKNGTLFSFSEQQLIDCGIQLDGCNGGWPAIATTYSILKGLELESDYPYTAQKGECQYNIDKAFWFFGRTTYVREKSAEALKGALVNSPISVCIQANQDIFQFYKSGVITENCGAVLNHCVLAVGYETVDNKEAFIVKNSWGTTWGQNGYVHIGAGPGDNGWGVCGILTQEIYIGTRF